MSDMSSNSNFQKSTSRSNTSFVGLFTRLVWLVGGPMALFALTLHAVFNPPANAVLRVLILGLITVLAVGDRLLDHYMMQGENADGAPSTLKDVVAYCRNMGLAFVLSAILTMVVKA